MLFSSDSLSHYKLHNLKQPSILNFKKIDTFNAPPTLVYTCITLLSNRSHASITYLIVQTVSTQQDDIYNTLNNIHIYLLQMAIEIDLVTIHVGNVLIEKRLVVIDENFNILDWHSLK